MGFNNARESGEDGWLFGPLSGRGSPSQAEGGEELRIDAGMACSDAGRFLAVPLF